MEPPRARANSMRIDFGKGSPEPKDEEIFSFLKTTLKLTCEVLLCMYRDPSESCVFVKFKTEELLLAALDSFPSTVTFAYLNGAKQSVSLSSATGTFKYVRLFNLPPEIEDREIASVMTKYGKIHRLVREKYALETGFPIWSGVRGLHMEITAEVPSTVHVRNFQARVFYSGMKNKCFVCGSVEHQKAECPKRRRPADKSAGASFKDVVTGLSGVGSLKQLNQQEEGPKMTGLGTLCPRSRAEQMEALKKAAEESRAEQAAALAPAVVLGEEDTSIDMAEVPPRDAEGHSRQEQVSNVDATRTDGQWTLVTRAGKQKEIAKGVSARSGVSSDKKVRALTRNLKAKQTLKVPIAVGGSMLKMQKKITRARLTERQQKRGGESSQGVAPSITKVTAI